MTDSAWHKARAEVKAATDRELLMQFAGYLSATLPEYMSQHPKEIGKHVEPFLQAARAAPAQPVCNCGDYKRGELTAGWKCPIHGQRW